MKSQVVRIVGLAVLLGSGAWAQLSRPLVADIPFDFTAGKTAFTAGEYVVRAGPSAGTLHIATEDGQRSAMMLVGRAEKISVDRQSKLVFNRYGDNYFLSQVWVAGHTTGVKVPPSAAEREIAKAITQPVSEAVVARKRQ